MPLGRRHANCLEALTLGAEPDVCLRVNLQINAEKQNVAAGCGGAAFFATAERAVSTSTFRAIRNGPGRRCSRPRQRQLPWRRATRTKIWLGFVQLFFFLIATHLH